jgi:hypothetical protein
MAAAVSQNRPNLTLAVFSIELGAHKVLRVG